MLLKLNVAGSCCLTCIFVTAQKITTVLERVPRPIVVSSHLAASSGEGSVTLSSTAFSSSSSSSSPSSSSTHSSANASGASGGAVTTSGDSLENPGNLQTAPLQSSDDNRGPAANFTVAELTPTDVSATAGIMMADVVASVFQGTPAVIRSEGFVSTTRCDRCQQEYPHEDAYRQHMCTEEEHPMDLSPTPEASAAQTMLQLRSGYRSAPPSRPSTPPPPLSRHPVRKSTSTPPHSSVNPLDEEANVSRSSTPPPPPPPLHPMDAGAVPSSLSSLPPRTPSRRPVHPAGKTSHPSSPSHTISRNTQLPPLLYTPGMKTNISEWGIAWF